MGMYTELNINVNFQSDTPDNIIDILKYMLGDISEVTTTSHPLFSTERWTLMLTCDSYYFDGVTHSSIVYDSISKEYALSVRSNFKNYNNELELFLDFIQPYLSTTGFIGYHRYEEYEDPTLIYNDNDGINYKFVED